MKLKAAKPPEVIRNAVGKQLNISVSSSENWDDCQAKWVLGYIYRIPTKEKESTRTGNGTHDVLETRLKTGEWKFEGKPLSPRHRYRVLAERGIKASGLNIVEGTGVKGGWQTEEWTPDDLMCGPLRFKGKVDIHRCLSEPYLGGLEIWDWKTAANPTASYQPTPVSLGYRRQPLLYGYTMGLKYGLQGNPFTARFIFMSTATDQAFALDAEEPIPWERAQAEWDKMIPKAEAMAVLAKKAEGQDAATFIHEVPYKTSACKKYGGCGYAGICPFSPANRTDPAYVNPKTLASIDPEKITMGGLADLANLGALAGVSTTPAAAITPPKPKAPPAPPPPSTDPDDKLATFVSGVEAMLQAGPFAAGIPSSMLAGMATGAGVDLGRIVDAMGLITKDGKFVLRGKPLIEVLVEPKPAAAAGVVIKAGATAGQVQALAEKAGVTFGQALSDNGLVLSCGLAVSAEDAAHVATLPGATGVTWLYAKHQGDNEGVAATLEVAEQVEAATVPVAPAKRLTASEELTVAVAWLEEQDWTAEGKLVSDIQEALKAGPMSHRQRLGGTFVGKAVDKFNGKGPAVLHVQGAGSKATVVPVVLVAEPEAAPPEPVRDLDLRKADNEPPPESVLSDEEAQALVAYGVVEPEPTTVGPDMAGIAAQLAQGANATGHVPIEAPRGLPNPPQTIAHLYVDVFIENAGESVMAFEQWAAQFTDQVMEYARQQGIEGADTGTWQLLNYGKGAGLYATVFRKAFAADEVPDLFVDSHSPLAPTFLAAARAAGKAVIYRGR